MTMNGWKYSLEPQRRHYVGGRHRPALGRAAFGDGDQLAREDPAPEHDGGVGAAEKLALAVLDAALPGLHRDVLHDREIGMAHVGEIEPAGPQLVDHLLHRRRGGALAVELGA